MNFGSSKFFSIIFGILILAETNAGKFYNSPFTSTIQSQSTANLEQAYDILEMALKYMTVRACLRCFKGSNNQLLRRCFKLPVRIRVNFLDSYKCWQGLVTKEKEKKRKLDEIWTWKCNHFFCSTFLFNNFFVYFNKNSQVLFTSSSFYFFVFNWLRDK